MQSALESFASRNPILAGAVALVAVVFVIALLAAIVSGLRGRRRRTAIRREPRLYGVADDGEGMPAYAEAPPAFPPVPAAQPPPAVRRGFGFAALVLAFILGAVAGIAAMLTARAEIARGLAQLAALAAPDPAGTAGDATAPQPGAPQAAAGASPPAATGAPGPAEDVGARLAAFATGLKAKLPRPAGPELALETVSVEGTTLNLGYGVARTMSPEEAVSFRAYVERTVRSLFCADEAGEIRYLSRNGVVFHMTYADPSGARLSELTVTPAYCG